MRFIIDKAIFKKFPSVRLGIVVALGIKNKNGHEIVDFLRQQEEKVNKQLGGKDISKHSHISCWRRTYGVFGANPRKYLSSIETLVKRVQKGEKIPNINPLVNLYNALSLKYLLPLGGEDLDRVKGDIYLKFAIGNEKGKYIGSEEIVTCKKGEVAYLDDLGFVCRRFNWREAERTKLTKETKNAVLVAEAMPPVSEKELKNAIEELANLIKKHLGGKTKLFYLDKNNQEFSLDFKAGEKLSKKEIDIASADASREAKKTAVIKESILTERKYTGSAKIISTALENIMLELGIPTGTIHLEHPANEAHGDYSTNVAMTTYGKSEIRNSKFEIKNPRELAQNIVEKLNQDKKLKNIVDKIEVAGGGFINFWLKRDWLVREAKKIVEKANTYGRANLWERKKIMVEYTDPNPFKEFHIGHLYSNIIGESLTKIFEALGTKIWRANFYGDVGMHVAKSVWGMIQKLKINPPADGEKLEIEQQLKKLEKKSLTERIRFLGQGYALGVRMYETDKKAREEIKELNYFVYVASQEVLKKDKNWQPLVDYKKYIKGRLEKLEQILPVYESGLKWSLAYFESIYNRLGTKFDGYYPESWTGELGMKLVEEGLRKNIFEKSKGSVVYRGEKDGLHTRVFVNKLGLPTYEAKDLGLAQAKYQDFKYDLSINIFGKEIDQYYKVVLAALKKIRPKLSEKSNYIAHGMVNLPEGKMSSRTGNVITVEWLLKQTKKQALKIMTDSDLSPTEKEMVVEMVAQAAVKYAFLKNNIGENIVFDFGRSVSLEGDSGPYLQYTYARCKSVMRKAKLPHPFPLLLGEGIEVRSINAEEVSLLRFLYRFPEVVIQAGLKYAPNLICQFLFELAQRYNTFYHFHSILKAETEEQKNFRLLLTAATAQVIKNGLLLLGIKVPNKM